VVRGVNLPSPIDLTCRPYNTVTLYGVIVWWIQISGLVRIRLNAKMYCILRLYWWNVV